jgi:hypothetical protein
MWWAWRKVNMSRYRLICPILLLVGVTSWAAPSGAAAEEPVLPTVVVEGAPTIGSTGPSKASGEPRAELPQLAEPGVEVVATGDGPSKVGAPALRWALKHDFSLTPAIDPVPYSCHGISRGYYCRSVYGYEEGGSGSAYDSDFVLTRTANRTLSALDGDHARKVVHAGGVEYEGCQIIDSQKVKCDYRTPRASRRLGRSGSGYWVAIFKDWAAYTAQAQGLCAATVTSVWIGLKTYFDIGNACRSAPFER